VSLRVLPSPRPPPLLSLDDEFFAGISDERIPVATPPKPQRVVPPPVPDEPPPGPAPFHDVGFDMDETTVLGPPSARTARGWAYRVDEILAPRGKTLRFRDGRLRFSRADFLRFSQNLLYTIAAYDLPVDPSRIPWGAFKDEEESFDQETDWERLRSWLEDR